MNTRDKVTTFMVAELKKIYPDWPVVLANQNFPKLPEQYLLVNLLAERNIGNQERWDTENEEIAIAGSCEATFNIQAFGTGAIDTLGQLGQHLERPSVVDEFFVANMAVNDVADVQDLTDLLDDTTWQERGSVDLTISYDRTVIDNPGWFETIRISGVLVEGDLINAAVPSKIKIETNIEIKEKPHEH